MYVTYFSNLEHFKSWQSHTDYQNQLKLHIFKKNSNSQKKKKNQTSWTLKILSILWSYWEIYDTWHVEHLFLKPGVCVVWSIISSIYKSKFTINIFGMCEIQNILNIIICSLVWINLYNQILLSLMHSKSSGEEEGVSKRNHINPFSKFKNTI